MSDIFDRQRQFFVKQVSQSRYCRLCGKPVLFCPTDEHNRPNPNYQWEWENSVHYKCLEDNYRKQSQGG